MTGMSESASFQRAKKSSGFVGPHSVTAHGQGSRDLVMRQRYQRSVDDNPAVLKRFLKFQGGFFSLTQEQTSLPAHICRVQQSTLFELRLGKRQVVGGCSFEILQRLRRIASPDFGVAPDRTNPALSSRLDLAISHWET
jgi:hypothetical protein